MIVFYSLFLGWCLCATLNEWANKRYVLALICLSCAAIHAFLLAIFLGHAA